MAALKSAVLCLGALGLLWESSQVISIRSVSCKDHTCPDGTTCHLVNNKPQCMPNTTSGPQPMFRIRTKNRKDLKAASFSSPKTMAMVKAGSVSMSTLAAKPGLFSVAAANLELTPEALSEPQTKPAAMVQRAPASVAGKESALSTMAGAELSPLLASLDMSTGKPVSRATSKPKTGSGSETVPVTYQGPQFLAAMQPSLDTGTGVGPQLETVSGSTLELVAKPGTMTVSNEVQRTVMGGTCWASGLPYIYTFDGYSFPVLGGCTYTLSHCPEPLARGLPAFHLWAACSGARQPVHSVTMRVFGTTITAVKHDFGFVRVNQQRLGLPVTLGNGQLRLSFRNWELWAEAGLEREPLALRLVYDWQHALSLQVAAGYSGRVAGLCGNFDGDPSNDREGPDPRAFLNTWGLQLPNDPCGTLWAAPCTLLAIPLQTPEPCGVLAAPQGPFRHCHTVLPPAPFESSCRAWTCPFPSHRPALCQALQVYARACQRLGVRIDSWRFQAGCAIDCPANSHYEPCGSPCPETCVGPSEATCHLPCGETCACDAGYELRGTACIPHHRGPAVACGCTHQGRPLAPGEVVWEGSGCARRHCLCPAAGGAVVCSKAGCSSGEHCVLAGGRFTCLPCTLATCTVAGGGHYVTFDGRHFHFHSGPCTYLLSSLDSAAPPELPGFRVLQNAGPEGAPGSLEVQVPGSHLRLDPKEPGRVLVNGDWQILPFQAADNSTLVFRRGWDTVVRCSFGLHMTYAPEIRVALDLPKAYQGHVVGLCANYNGDPLDDLRIPGAVASPELPENELAWAFGHSCLVGTSVECSESAAKMPPLPPSCVTLSTTSSSAQFSHSCDLLVDPQGPFRLCHELLAPKPYFQDCVAGVCQGTGPCSMLSLYSEACQLLGCQIFPWRKANLCSPQCHAHAHYSLCAPSCPVTCAGPEPLPGCRSDSRCREGCVCDEGFLQSGAACVPAAQCGCLLGGRYFEPGTPLPPPASSSTRLTPCCHCQPGGRVTCQPCQVAKNGPGLCLAWGRLGFRTFDGTTFHLPDSCTSLLLGTGRSHRRGVWPFRLTLERGHSPGPGESSVRRLLLQVQGHRFSLQCQDWGHLMVDGVRGYLPFTLPSGGVRAFTRGASVVLVVRGGPRLLFSHDCQLSMALPVTYQGLTQGLCGNFNGLAQDDLLLNGPCPALQPCLGSSCSAAAQIPDVVINTDMVQSNTCDLLLDPRGPLASCHSQLPPQPFFQACTADMHRAPGNGTVICAWLQTYVSACHAAGASIRPWRGPNFCSLQCPSHSHYSLCVNPCPAPCLGVQKVVQLPAPCSEGCECDEGFFPAGGDCVPVDYCSCFHNGQYFRPGEIILSHNCSSSCTCRPRDGVTCISFNCPLGTVCGIVDGVLGCRAPASPAPAPSPLTPRLLPPPIFPIPHPQCPPNSHFVPCGSACPDTCAQPSASKNCGRPCVPTCQCLPGFLLLEGLCVPSAHCLCLQHHHHTFWTNNCTQHCRCLTLGAVGPQCQPDTCLGHCKASADGWELCLLGQSLPGAPSPEEPLTCTVTGDFHFHTFGGTHYEFSGSCVYRLAGLCDSHPAGLESFSLDVTLLLQPHGCPKALTLSACGLRVDMNPKDLNRVQVNGILESLPLSHGSCLHAYLRGYQLSIHTSFGLLLTYDWHGLVRVTLPRSYGPYLCGLCSTNSPTASDTWKVAEVPGCGPVCGPLCPSPCPVAARQRFTGDEHCGLLVSAQGPLEPCHTALDPLPFFNDCLDDVCRHRGAHNTVCQALATYTTACQALGVRLWPWRTPDFCSFQCPPHSQYELCGPCCQATCAGTASCEAPGSITGRCCEGCVCQEGFVRSGGLCVPAAQCGCFQAGRYRPRGTVWYLGPSCRRRCRCGPNGVVTCGPRPCGHGQVCGLRGGVRRCLPDGRAYCTLAGPVHVLDFEGHPLALPVPVPFSPERCLDVLARTIRPGAWAFSLDMARDGAGPLSLHFSLAGRRLQLDRHVVGVITVDGERWQLPWTLPGGQVWATLEGRHVVVHAICGLRLLYDWGSQVHLSVPSAFHGRLAGLCGAFGNDKDPLNLPLDTRSSPTGPVAVPCPLPAVDLGFSMNCSMQFTPLFKAPKICGLLQAPDGPFGKCLGQVDPKPFLRICLQDECHSQDGNQSLCQALTAYTAACQEAGIPVLPWRSPSLCPMSCPPRYHYNVCAKTCAGGCVLPASPAHCATQCYEGCECEPGLVFDGTDCVSRDHCGCLHNGRYLPVGETFILPGCQERCVCVPGHGLQCQPFSCTQGTSCILDGGSWHCEAGEGATCRLVPGGLLTTFDGFRGLAPTPVTPCAYELATLMGSRSQDPDWFHVIADFPPCPGCSTPQAQVIIGFRDGCAAVGPNGDVWVNGRRTRLPAQVCRGVVARWAEGSGVIIERSPTLRVQVGLQGAVALRASPALRGRLRAACGDYNGIAADDLRFPGAFQGASLVDMFQGCQARSFSSCTEQPGRPAETPPLSQWERLSRPNPQGWASRAAGLPGAP